MKYQSNKPVEIGICYDVPTNLLTVNTDLRKIKEGDTKVKAMFESIRLNGVLQPVTVWCTKDEKGKRLLRTITGNHRIRGAQIAELETVPVIFEHCENEGDYIRKAYNLNFSKASAVSELFPHIKEDIKTGLSVSDVASKYGISEKSVYSAVRIVGNEVLEEIAQHNFKNAYYLSNRKALLENDEIVKIAKTGTIDQLEKAVQNLKDKAKLRHNENTGDSLPGTAEKGTETGKEYSKERQELFFKQLENFNRETIDTAKLKRFLYGEIKDWMKK